MPLFGYMKVLFDVNTVSSWTSSSSSGAAPDVAPVLRMPVLHSFQLNIVCIQLMETLLVDLVVAFKISTALMRGGLKGAKMLL